jgi:very-short-patch-repair endonuclease
MRREPRRRAAAIAARQHGAISCAQLLAAGLTYNAIAACVADGFLVRWRWAVYAVGYVPQTPVARAMAATLACGPTAVVSHRSAAELREIGSRWRGAIEVTCASKRERPGIEVHRSRTLAEGARTRYRNVPITTVPRTVVDLAEVLRDIPLARAVNEARVTHRMSQAQLALAVAEKRGALVARRLRPFLDPGQGPTDSVFEDMFLAFAERIGVPRPETGQTIAGHKVDMVWRRQRLIVELDGRAFHDNPRAFERDRERDAALTLAGWRVIRITWSRLMRAPDEIAALLRALLDPASAVA